MTPYRAGLGPVQFSAFNGDGNHDRGDPPDPSRRLRARRCRPGRRRSRSRASIGPRLAQDAVGAELDGRKIDLREPLRAGGAFRLFTTKNPEAGEFVRHSAEHVLADAVKRLWPEAEIDAGRKDHSEKFQYDFRFPRAFTPEDLEKIEAKMREILAEEAPSSASRSAARRPSGSSARCGETSSSSACRTFPRATRSPSTATAASPTSAAARTRSGRPDRRGEAARVVRRLLQGRREQRAPAADLRHRLRLAEGAGRVHGAARAGAGARPPPPRPGARPVQLHRRWRRRCRSSIPRGRASTTA